MNIQFNVLFEHLTFYAISYRLTYRDESHEEYLYSTADNCGEKSWIYGRSENITVNQFPTSLFDRFIEAGEAFAVTGIVPRNVPSESSYHDHR